MLAVCDALPIQTLHCLHSLPFPPPPLPSPPLPQGLPRKLHSIKVQILGIAGLSWSPDDSLILVSGTGEEKHVYIYHTEVREGSGVCVCVCVRVCVRASSETTGRGDNHNTLVCQVTYVRPDSERAGLQRVDEGQISLTAGGRRREQSPTASCYYMAAEVENTAKQRCHPAW